MENRENMKGDENIILYHKKKNFALNWYGHVERISEEGWSKNIFQYSSRG